MSHYAMIIAGVEKSDGNFLYHSIALTFFLFLEKGKLSGQVVQRSCLFMLKEGEGGLRQNCRVCAVMVCIVTWRTFYLCI